MLKVPPHSVPSLCEWLAKRGAISGQSLMDLVLGVSRTAMSNYSRMYPS